MRVTAQHKLLRQGIHLLTLFQAQIIRCHIVLVHHHPVLQVLIAGGRGEEQPVHVIADAQTRVQHIALIAVHDGSGGVLNIRERCRQLRIHIIIALSKLAIAETVLIHPLIVYRPVELQGLCGLPDETCLATGLQALVVLLVKVLIIKKSLQPAVET